MKSRLLLIILGYLLIGATVSIAQGGEKMANNKKVLVVYYSKTGNTERVAKDIASRLHADIEKITDKKNRSGFLNYFFAAKDASKKSLTELGELQKNPVNYDLTIIGTPIWAWNMAPAVRAYLTKTGKQLKKVAFFTTSGNTDPKKVVGYMEEVSGKKAIALTGFNAKELKDKKIYDEKISAFVTEIVRQNK
ncbi:MAG: hypothetical protein DKM50_10865 [Candidatus Margulisiibacteriota bacterium]|nr:MAG: hypothetical protein DKM50_10865 [Candidatus Margulisiibacteriota bacterium]HCT85037.1 hypothetical protein [Candidatus Margulisiibacteriota bacterium]HCY38002.1 hypothetical protein [Candidatus Margulisiibacteriota bacterium]